MPVIAILLFAAALSAGTDSAACIVGIPLDKVAESHPLIFEGEVAGIPGEIVLSTADLPPGVARTGLRVVWSVAKVWRGDPGKSIETVYTDHAGQIHGRFRKGQRFVVWASMHEGRWQTSDCAPTIERDQATPGMLAFLDRLKK